jgi:hypothetical protein
MITYPSKTSAELGNFGIGHLTIKEAASLIAKCLLCNGDIEIDYEVEVVSLHDEKLDEVLKEHIAFYEDKLVSAIEKQSLKSPLITRDINENIDKEETYIDCGVLDEWLENRGVYLGDLYREDYLDEVCSLLEIAEQTIEKELIKRRNPELVSKYNEDKEYDILSLYKRISDLEKELSQKTIHVEKSLSTRTRETALKLIIGMAIKGYGYNPKANKNTAVKEIADDLALLGLQLDVDTVRKWLNEASELLPIEC